MQGPIVPPLAMAVLALIVWQVLSLVGGAHTISSPAETFRRLISLMGTVHFWGDVIETGRGFVLAFALSVLFGLALGVPLGLNRASGEILEPILVNFYGLPKVTLYPLVLLVFGLGLSAKVAFGVMHGLVPITLMTRNAIAQLKPVYWRTGRVMNLGNLSAIRRIVLPAILPELVGGMRLGFSLSLLGVLIGEMFASKRGLGFAAMNAMGLGDVTTIMAIGLFLAALAIAANLALLALETAIRHR